MAKYESMFTMRNLLVLSLALNLSLITRVFFDGEKYGLFLSVENQKQRGPSFAADKEAHATQKTLLSLSSSGQEGMEKVINLDQ